MNKQPQALKLALEALEETLRTLDDENAKPGGAISDTIWHSEHETLFDYIAAQITAIREALADSALDRMAENARELGIQMQPEQKPIARLQWADGWTVTLLTGAEDIPLRSGPYALYVGPAPEQPAQQQEPVCDKDPQGCWSVRCQLGKVCKNTSPQPSKPWVGLVWGELPEDGHNHDFLRGAAWAEAKLREKNT